MYNLISNKLNNESIEIVCLDEVDSTSSYIRRELNSFGNKNVLVTAKKQTAGRGRNGKSFYSPESTGLYMSVLLHPACALADAVGITTCAAVAVAKAIEKVTGKNTGIKWVNDLYVDNKKVCGILCEAVNNYKQGITQSVIIGVGVNLSTAVFPDELKDVAGSLNTETDCMAELCAEIANAFFEMPFGKISEDILEEYRRRSVVIGKTIDYYVNGQKHTARAIGIDSAGGLIVDSDGEISTLSSGEISVRFS